jgi:hypothetical protein
VHADGDAGEEAMKFRKLRGSGKIRRDAYAGDRAGAGDETDGPVNARREAEAVGIDYQPRLRRAVFCRFGQI